MAKKAVDSTFKRILNYTAEIIISIILLVTISIPLAFTIPMWFEHVFFNVPRTELTINPANWFGLDGTLWITLLLALASFTLAYLYIIKLKPGETSDSVEDKPDDEEEEETDSADEEKEELTAEDLPEEVAEDIPLEDQEEEEEPDLDAIEESVEEESEED
ncbi:MAG: hypothetical protein ACTSWA_05960 [Candidatus Thorarchaeota archaeon]